MKRALLPSLVEELGLEPRNVLAITLYPGHIETRVADRNEQGDLQHDGSDVVAHDEYYTYEPHEKLEGSPDEFWRAVAEHQERNRDDTEAAAT